MCRYVPGKTAFSIGGCVCIPGGPSWVQKTKTKVTFPGCPFQLLQSDKTVTYNTAVITLCICPLQSLTLCMFCTVNSKPMT